MRKMRIAALILLAAAVPVAASLAVRNHRSPAAIARAQVEEEKGFFLNLLTVQADSYWHKGDYENCVRMLTLQTELDPHWLEPYDQAGWLLWSMKRLEAAEEIYKRGIANNPDTYRLYFELGHMYYRTARPSLYEKTGEESRRLFEKAAEQLYLAVRRPCPGNVDRLLAHALHQLGRYAEERQVLQNLLKKNPTDALAQRDLKRLQEMGK